MRVRLNREWDIGEQIGGGGFGRVHAAVPSDQDGKSYVAKFVPKAPGAQRELLFVKLDGIRNIVPTVDSGETQDCWVIVMPRAEKSLREHMTNVGSPFDTAEVIEVMADVATALSDLDGKVVHRDLKPENILLLDGKWCLADFGISRYAEATTAPDTQKYAMSLVYAAPERWRAERATIATDVYALGVIGFELVVGGAPFSGSDVGDFRDQHLHVDPPALTNIPVALAGIIAACLYKSAGARPAPQDILARLPSARLAPASAGRARLQQANMREVARLGESARRESAQRSAAERRADLVRDATNSFNQIVGQLKSAIAEDAPSAVIQESRSGGLTGSIGGARFELSGFTVSPSTPWGGWKPPAFEVIAHASLGIKAPRSRTGYEGRAHSLWFCDAREPGRYGWFETAFMLMPLINRSSPIVPFAMDPGEGSAKALWSGMAEYQVAWPFTPTIVGDLTEFVDRWIGWLGDAASGALHHPTMIPEPNTEGSWRR